MGQCEPVDGFNSEADYRSKQVITYLGNKRRLMPFIMEVMDKLVSEICVARTENSLPLGKVSFCEPFSGSGVVARYMRPLCHHMYLNDLERYSQIINECYQTNRKDIPWGDLETYRKGLANLIENYPHGGFISELYAPESEKYIRKSDRVFYTCENALFLDSFCHHLPKVVDIPSHYKFMLAPVLWEASNFVNTSGIFKGFHKDRNNIGCYGGATQTALKRIKHKMEVLLPVSSEYDCDVSVSKNDAFNFLKNCELVDIAYFDPPYNQHPYGSNYFMLNLLCNYVRPQNISKVAGIPNDWNRSRFNKKRFARDALFECINECKAKYVVISFNADGFISEADFVETLEKMGELSIMSKDYTRFRGHKTKHVGRKNTTQEFLFVLRKDKKT